MKEKLPDMDAVNSGLLIQNPLHYLEPRMMNLVNDFEARESKFLESIDEAAIRDLFDRADELEAGLTNFQLFFLKT
ncbi:MAG: hypothetical protein HWN65_16910 [Candidatus Helarchaeota archaeon]|nr:hypothetical protein [Candidatus Helarchaeota archaeon]